jgi:hypothetical protein
MNNCRYWSYFKQVAIKSRAQSNSYIDYAHKQPGNEATQGPLYNSLAKNKFFDDKLVETDQFKNKKRQGCCSSFSDACQKRTYLRAVLHLDAAEKKQKQLTNVDQIEVNCVKMEASELWDVSSQVDVQILLAIGVLYGAFNPFVAVLALTLLGVETQLHVWLKVNVY